MGLFNRTPRTPAAADLAFIDDTNERKAAKASGAPYEVDNVLDLTRDPATTVITWSDGRTERRKA